MPAIRLAQWPADLTVVAGLFRQYQAELDIDLCFQGFAAELAKLPKRYVAVFLLEDGAETAGCVALGLREEGVAEIKRLYVAPRLRGQAWGRRLAETALAEAQRRGCNRVVLDTIAARMPRALALYRSLGFRECGQRIAGSVPLLDMEWLAPETQQTPERDGKPRPGF